MAIADIKVAERAVGASDIASGREVMLDNLDDNLTKVHARRSVRPPNAAPCATGNDLRLPGFAIPAADGSLRLTASVVSRPADFEDIGFAPVTHLSAWVAGHRLSSRRPTEIPTAQIAAFPPRFVCIAVTCFDLTFAEAVSAHGLTRARLKSGRDALDLRPTFAS